MFAEIVEHIPDPHYSLRELRRSLQPGSPAFITTVVNSNAIDHIFLFKDPREVPPLLTQAGFEIVAEKVLKVSDYGSSRDPSIDVAYVCLAN
jgi:2-polyprenyl-3-methyl-5-hydroxy-6-metoxy-1,4-benzoquinol methylase